MSLFKRNNFYVLVFGFLSFTSKGQDCVFDLSACEDKIICEPGCVDLNGDIDGDYLFFEWNGSNGFFDNEDLDPCAPVDEFTTFSLSVTGIVDENLVENGGFEDGFTGFTSEYDFNPNVNVNGLAQGSFNIDDQVPNFWANQCDPIDDNMMVINGATVPDVNIYCTMVDVDPDTDYAFSIDLMTINTPVPMLQFSINGVLLGDIFEGGPPCEIESFFELWNSGGSSSAEICIVNQATAASGNDFSLDNISFAALCVDEISFAVEIAPPILDVDVEDLVLDCNTLETIVFSDVTPSDRDYTYQWSTIDGNIVGETDEEEITVDQGGTYTLFLEDEYGCTQEMSIEVEGDLEPPFIDVEIPDLLTCGGDPVELVIDVDDWDGIIWMDEDGNVLFEDALNYFTDVAGNYFVEVIGLNGCVETEMIVLEADTDLPQLEIESAGALSCTGGEVTLTVVTTSFIDVITWSNGSNEMEIVVTEAGFFEVVIIDDNGCSGTATFTVEADEDLPEVMLISSGDLDCSGDAVTISVDGPDTNLSYLWNDGSMASSIDVISEGTYLVTVTGENGCELIDSITLINTEELPEFSIVPQGSIDCNGGSVNLSIMTNDTIVSYIWSTGSTEMEIEVDQAGIYTVILTAINGCSQMEEIEILDMSDSVQYQLSNVLLDCNQNDLLFDPQVTGDIAEIVWRLPDGSVVVQNDILLDQAGQYFIEISDLFGCQIIDSLNVEIDTIAPSFDFDVVPISCDAEGSITIELDGDYEVMWEIGGMMISDELQVFSSMVEDASLTLIGDNGCETNMVISFVSQIDIPEVEILGSDIDCNNLMVDITAMTDQTNSLVWTGPNGFSSTDAMINVGQGGVYVLSVSNAQGCMIMDSIVIGVDTMPPSLMLDLIPINCFQDEAVINIVNFDPTLDYSYVFDNQTPIDFDESFASMTPGTYEIIAVDPSNGCETIEFLFVEDYVPLSADISVVDPACIDGNGLLDVGLVEGGLPPYEWSLDGDDFTTQTSFADLAVGMHELLIRDSEGCTINRPFEILEGIPFEFEVPEVLILDSNQGIVLQPILPNPESQVTIAQWTPAELFSCDICLNTIFLGTESINVTLEITDQFGCSASTTIFIEVPSDDFFLELPNVFSPHNNTGVNDFFFPISSETGIEQVNHMRVYDRWGNKVFENLNFQTNDTGEGWNGRYQGERLNPGVFVYHLEALTTGGEVIMRVGSVTLVD